MAYAIRHFSAHWMKLALAGLILAAIAAPGHAADGKRIALLVGNENYAPAIGRLQNPHNDVKVLAKALAATGFDVTVKHDLTYRGIDIALKRHVRRLREAGEGAVGFFYYSGHGVANEKTKTNYLVPTDVENARDDSFWDSAYEQSLVIDRLRKRAPDATHYVVFDACRNELNVPGRAAKSLSENKGMVPAATLRGILIAYATAPGQTASDAGDGVGPYAKILAEEIVKPGVESVMMFRRVQLRVHQAINQEPWLSLPFMPEIYLAGKAVPKPPPTASPAPSSAAMAHYNANYSAAYNMPGNLLYSICVPTPPANGHLGATKALARHLTQARYEVGWLPGAVGPAALQAPIDSPHITWSGTLISDPNRGLLQIYFGAEGNILHAVASAVDADPAASGKPGIRLQGVWQGRNGQGCFQIHLGEDGIGRGIVAAYPNQMLRFPIFMRPKPTPAGTATAAARNTTAPVGSGPACAEFDDAVTRFVCRMAAHRAGNVDDATPASATAPQPSAAKP